MASAPTPRRASTIRTTLVDLVKRRTAGLQALEEAMDRLRMSTERLHRTGHPPAAGDGLPPHDDESGSGMESGP